MKIRNRRAAVTGHEFPHANLRPSGGEGGKEAWHQESEYFIPQVSVRRRGFRAVAAATPSRDPGGDGISAGALVPGAFSLGSNTRTIVEEMHIRPLVAAGALAFCLPASAATVTTTADLIQTFGSGANSATLVIDFNDGSPNDSFAWGYRFDGQISGAAMILAIAAADPNLSLTAFGDASSGFFLTEIRYLDGTTLRTATASTSAPWEYWSYWIDGGFADGAIGSPTAVAGGGSNLPGSWTESPVGASEDSFGSSGRFLSDGAWDAWSFGEYGLNAPSGPVLAAVPEPSSSLLLTLAGFTLLIRRRPISR